MPLKARQFAIAQNTATLLVPKSSFNNQPLSVGDSLPIQVKNEDSTATVWIGGPDVTATQGQSLAPGNVTVMNTYNADYPWAYTTASSNPIVSVLVGRQ